MSNSIVRRKTNFSTIPNQLLNDPEISLSAKGLYVFMHGKPPNWNFTIRSMSNQLKEGVTAISNALNELKESGWIEYKKFSDGKGEYLMNWEKPDADNPNLDNPNLDNPKLGKPACINKKDLLVTKNNSKTDKDLMSGKPDVGAVEKSLLDYLNTLANRNYKPVPSNIKFLKARLAEGHTPQEIADVIARKCAEWLDDPKFSQYLRPATLFNAEKFNQYVGELGQPLPPKRTERQKPSQINDNSTGWSL